ncbi:MAG: flavin reductase family protein [Chloroflexi bacterium]|nr:flavin reductase family protein [Chloroflexota bacterium]MDA1145923.1 flavin reductase family protein [Chloroflexota bacterium]
MNSDALLKPAPKGIERRPVTTASRLLMGGPVALVTSRYRGQTNVMPLAWHMPISSDPPLIAIAIEQSRYSVEMIDHSEEFALNIPKRPLLHHVQYLGALRGENIDKLEAAQLAHFAPSRITAPLIEGCAAWIEAGVRHQLPFGDHVLYVAEVMAVHVDPASFSDRWRTDVEDDRPLTFLGGNHYSSLSREQNARPPRDLDAPERVLAERMAEELELTAEAHERREELAGRLAEEVRRGNVVDVSEIEHELDLDEADLLDLSEGVALGDSD